MGIDSGNDGNGRRFWGNGKIMKGYRLDLSVISVYINQVHLWHIIYERRYWLSVFLLSLLVNAVFDCSSVKYLILAIHWRFECNIGIYLQSAFVTHNIRAKILAKCLLLMVNAVFDCSSVKYLILAIHWRLECHAGLY